eukprot:TRINITY_DN6657_c0_g2_i1.p1 TRINITY_DN6657_c0_g2~~TRINITY_DN6657_c0_g2_i1.p1  ORF type:complete len:616 (+),score=294.47 TRINITY_DN6657_c0_g2_i1:332-2179(+)
MSEDVASKEEARLLRTMNRIATGGKVTPIQFNNDSSSNESETVDSSILKGFSTASGKSMTSTWRLKQDEAKRLREEQELQEKMKKERMIKSMAKSSSVPTLESNQSAPPNSGMKSSNSLEKPKEDHSKNVLSSPRSPRKVDPLASFVSGLIKKEEERLSSPDLKNQYNSIGNRGESKKEPIKIVNSFEAEKENKGASSSNNNDNNNDKTPAFVKNIWNPPSSSSQLNVSSSDPTNVSERLSEEPKEIVKEMEVLSVSHSSEGVPLEVERNDLIDNGIPSPIIPSSSSTKNNHLPVVSETKEKKENLTESIETKQSEIKPLESSIHLNNNHDSAEEKETKQTEAIETEKKVLNQENNWTAAELQQQNNKEVKKEDQTKENSIKQEDRGDQVVRSIVAKARAVISSLVVSSPNEFSRSLFEENSRILIGEFAQYIDCLGYSDEQKRDLVLLLKYFAQSGKAFLLGIHDQISLESFNELSLPVKQQMKEVLSFIRQVKGAATIKLERENRLKEMNQSFGTVSFKVVEMIKLLQQPIYDKQESTSKVQELIVFIRKSIAPHIQSESQKMLLLSQLKDLLHSGIEMNLMNGDFGKRNEFVQHLKGSLQSLVTIKHQLQSS